MITAGDADQRIDPASYTIEEVARRLAEFIHNEHYLPEFRDLPSKPPLGLAVSGYSSGSDVHPSMPIKDAIDIAEYLVNCTIGFKWIARKHYFSRDLNSGKEEWLCNAISPRLEVQDRCV